MANRIKKYLDNMDELRKQSNNEVDELLKKIDIKILLKYPEQTLKAFVFKLIENNKDLFKNARQEGFKLGKSL